MLDKHNLLVSFLQRLDAPAVASNWADGVPSIIVQNDIADETSAGSKISKTSTLTAAENFARLFDSTKSLSSTALAITRIEAEQKEKDRAFALEETKKDRAATICVAEIGSGAEDVCCYP